jgi:hypothetical protein
MKVIKSVGEFKKILDATLVEHEIRQLTNVSLPLLDKKS